MKYTYLFALSLFALNPSPVFCTPDEELEERAAGLVSLIPQENSANLTLFDKNIEACYFERAQPWAMELLELVVGLYQKAEIKLPAPSTLVREATNTAYSILKSDNGMQLFERLDALHRMIWHHQQEISRYRGLHSPSPIQSYYLSEEHKAFYDLAVFIYENFIAFYIQQAKALYANDAQRIREEAAHFSEAAPLIALPTSRHGVWQITCRPQFFHPTGIYIVNNTTSGDLGTIYEVGKSAENEMPLIRVRADLAPHHFGITLTRPAMSERTAHERRRTKTIGLFGGPVECTILDRPPQSGKTPEGYYVVEAPGQFYDGQSFFVSCEGEITQLSR